MIVILEGPDGSGKTTLAKALGAKDIHHEGVPQREDLLQYYADLVVKASTSGGLHVFDRLHLGELVYGPIMRGRERLGGAHGLKIFNRLVSSTGAKIVLCQPAYVTCLKNRQGREEYVDDIIFPRIYQKYWEFVGQCIHYDYQEMSIGTLFKRLSSWEPPLPAGVIGARRPKFLFVGEKPNHEWLDLPFFSTTGSSRYLNDCLEEAGYQESEMAFVNAFKITGAPYPLSIIANVLKPTVVITLGGMAHRMASLVNAPVVNLHHPQYRKRFKAHDRTEYVEALRAIRTNVWANAGC